MLQMYTTAQGIDVITVLEEVKKQEVFSAENEAKVYLTQLVQVVPGTSNVVYYAKIVQEKYFMRRLITVAQDILTYASEPQTESRSLMELTEQKLYDIRKGKDSTGLIHINKILLDVYGRIQSPEQSKASSVPSGFSGLDRITNGLNRSDLILLAARPAMGKSTFAFNIATNVAKKGYTVAVFSLEMSREQVVNKILSAMASVDGTKLRAGDLPIG
ncbi:MAG: replicative DNA helicase, partial [Oscillospiraceae bacterium]|nr:replicative DNA helicase [Oscillospiraceae bacterium]